MAERPDGCSGETKLAPCIGIHWKNKSKPYYRLLMVFSWFCPGFVLVFKTKTVDKPPYGFCESDGFLLVFN